MRFVNKKIYIYISSSLFIIISFFLLNNSWGEDLMEQAFKEAMNHQTVINIGNTKNAVGNTILRETMSIGIGESFSKACFINGQIKHGVSENVCTEMGGEWKKDIINVQAKAPLIVRITKFLLRMTIVLSITMIIFNAVKYMIEVLGGKDRKSAESKKNLIFIAGGIILALMSVSVINLIISVPKSSLKTSDDLSAFQIGCKTGTTILVGNDLKKRICENSTFGHPKDTLNYRVWNVSKVGNRCRFPDDDVFDSNGLIITGKNPKINKDGTRKSITQGEMKSKCVEDLGGEIIE